MSVISCAKCGATLLGANFNTGAFADCPGCGAPARIEIFPALFKTITRGAAVAPVVAEAEAGCFYHPEKRAAVSCESCGRFLCDLCDLELNGRHLCPACLASGKKKGRLRELERERMLYDKLALMLATLPLLFWPLTLISAPVAIYVAIRYWRAPASIVRRGKTRFIVALLLASIQVAGWVTLFVFLIFFRR